MRVGIGRDKIFLDHEIDVFHPESPQRLVSIYEMVDGLGHKGFVQAPRRMATHEEIALNHDLKYIELIEYSKGKPQVRLDADTATSPDTYEAACVAAGAVLQLGDMLMNNEIDSGFALVRPPGHHAEQNRAMGFCIFNNIAIGARYLENKYALKRVLIVDWDLHHGNGTQHSFYEDETVLYFSTHQYPYYPGTGWVGEIGEGAGKGYTINVPLSYGMKDEDYLFAFQEVLVPLADRYRPEIVMVSAGFDPYYNDPLGGMSVTESGFAGMTKVLMDIAHKYCGGKILFALEGGYDVAGLTSSVKSVLLELLGESAAISAKDGKPSSEIAGMAAKAKEVLRPFWGDF